MSDATTTRQKTIRDRASACPDRDRTAGEVAAEDGAAIARLSTAATTRPSPASEPSSAVPGFDAGREQAPPSRARSGGSTTTSSAQAREGERPDGPEHDRARCRTTRGACRPRLGSGGRSSRRAAGASIRPAGWRTPGSAGGRGLGAVGRGSAAAPSVGGRGLGLGRASGSVGVGLRRTAQPGSGLTPRSRLRSGQRPGRRRAAPRAGRPRRSRPTRRPRPARRRGSGSGRPGPRRAPRRRPARGPASAARPRSASPPGSSDRRAGRCRRGSAGTSPASRRRRTARRGRRRRCPAGSRTTSSALERERHRVRPLRLDAVDADAAGGAP